MSSGSGLYVSFVDHRAFFAIFPALVFFPMIVMSMYGTGSSVNRAQEASIEVIHPSDICFPRHASWMQPGSSTFNVQVVMSLSGICEVTQLFRQ
jgi:hypothetical protein